MISFERLEEAWQAAPPLPTEQATVDLLVLRLGEGAHETPDHTRITPKEGVVGDRWTIDKGTDQQVTLMTTRVAGLVADGGPLHGPGDNILCDLDLSTGALPVGTRLKVGGVLLEVSAKPHTGCKKFNERFGPAALRWVNLKEHRARRLRGINCRVVEGGSVAVGDPVVVVRV